MRTQRGFTLIELIFVISIFVFLISMLLPALNEARQAARMAQCASQQQQIMTAVIYYSNDWRDIVLYNIYETDGALYKTWPEVIASSQYLNLLFPGTTLIDYAGKNGFFPGVLHCPNDEWHWSERPPRGEVTEAHSYGKNGSINFGCEVRAPWSVIPNGARDSKVAFRLSELNGSHLAMSDSIRRELYPNYVNTDFEVGNGGFSKIRHNMLVNAAWYDGHVSKHDLRTLTLNSKPLCLTNTWTPSDNCWRPYTKYR